jgi:acetyltransferase
MSSQPRSAAGDGLDALHPVRRALDALLRPRRIAVVCTSDDVGSLGHVLVHHLQAHKRDTVFVVSPTQATIAGIPTYPSLAAIPQAIDLALVAAPAAALPSILHECGAAGVATAVIFAASAGARAEARAALSPSVLGMARRHGLRLVGPTSFGLQRPRAGINASVAATPAKHGSVAFASQSDAVCQAVLDWSVPQNVGFSAFLSLGSMLDVEWADVLDVLGDDFHTDSIVLHMETVGDARAFVSAAREVALRKPVIVLKTEPIAGLAEQSPADAGTLLSPDAVFDAVARRCGVVRVDTVADLFNMAEVLGKQGRPHGPRLAIMTNAGGPGTLAANALLRSGGALAPVPHATIAALGDGLPPQVVGHNPLHLGDDADAHRYQTALDGVAKSRAADGVLVIFTPHADADPHAVAQAIVPYAKMTGTPLLASWMGGAAVRDGEEVLNRAGIPTFAYPDTAARMFSTMWHYSTHLRSLYETPMLAMDDQDLARDHVAAIIERARHAGRTMLDEAEAARVLAAYGISTPSGQDAATGYALRLASMLDPQCGPVLLFGAGGVWAAGTEPLLGLPPLTTTLARRMLEQGDIGKALTDDAGRPLVDMPALEQLLVRFSHLVVEHPQIKEMCINPLLATPAQVVALHTTITLHEPELDDEHVPRPVIRPYPTQYVAPWTLKDGTSITIRPIRAEDEPLLVRFHATLSERSVFFRYFAPLPLSRRTDHERLTRICFIDYDREMALVAEHIESTTGEHHILAVGRLVKLFGTSTAEFALLISDQAQGQGLGTELLRRLIAVGRAEGMEQIIAQILPENRAMQRVSEKLGFRLRRILHDNVVLAELDLCRSDAA